MNGFIVVVAGLLEDVVVKAFDDYQDADAYRKMLHIGHPDIQRILSMLKRDMSSIEHINIYDMRNGQVWEIL